MNATKKLIFALTAGATLIAAAPAFADRGGERDHDYYRGRVAYSQPVRQGYREQYRGDNRPEFRARFRDDDRREYREHFRDFDRGRYVVAQRPMFVAPPLYAEPPVYYAQPAPMRDFIGPAALIGAVIGGYIDSRH